MKTERNQLASVGRHNIWSLSDAPPEKEAFQSTRIHRDGIAKPLLDEETPSFPFHNSQIFNTFCVRRKSPPQQVQSTAHGDGEQALDWPFGNVALTEGDLPAR